MLQIMCGKLSGIVLATSLLVALVPIDARAEADAFRAPTLDSERTLVILPIRDRDRVLLRSERDRVMGRLVARLVSLPGVHVVSEPSVKEARAALRPCGDEQCYAKLGRVLAAQAVLRPKIERPGRGCTFTVEVFDVANASRERLSQRWGGCDVDSMRHLTDEAVARVFPERRAPESAPSVVRTMHATSQTYETQFEIEVGGSVSLLVFTDEADPDPGDFGPGAHLLHHTGTFGVAVLWRETGPFFLRGEAALASFYLHENGDSTGSGDSGGGWYSISQVYRFELKGGRNAWGALPSDRIAIDVGVGPYLFVSQANEAGLKAHIDLKLAWLRLGPSVTFGAETGLGAEFGLGLRFGI